MSILTGASSSSVRRGYEYFKEDRVKDVRQLNDYEFEGYVSGSLNKPYYVKIDIEHPKKSYCDCPHANGNIICKHMTALYFELFPDEVDDYESWLNSDYDEDDDEEEFDDYYDYNRYYEDDYYDYRESNNFKKPLFFDLVLEKYVYNLSIDELKQTLISELKNNEKRTYDLYIKKNYSKFLNTSGDELVFLDRLNKKVQDLIGYYDYNYNDYDREILTIKEKRKIEELYKNKSLQLQIDEILLNEKLSVYSGYVWIANFYKRNKSIEEIAEFCKKLDNYLDNLKHYSIKNLVPKSNILIVIYLLNDFTIPECANSLLNNAKYLQYVDYIIENSNDVMSLYCSFMKLIEKNYLKNKMYIPDILYRFVVITNFEDENIILNHYFYSYLCLGQVEYLNILGHYLTEDKIISVIESKTKNIFLLVNLYNYYDKKEKLWNLLKDNNYKYLLIDNITILKDKYNEELYKHFFEEFYNVLKEGKNREIYHKASKYIAAISKLNNSSELLEKILKDLKNSEYQKCSALFDEINKVI